MSSNLPEPHLYSIAGGVLSLSNRAVEEILRAILAKNVPVRFKARGSSMHPFIHHGDVLTISPRAGRRLQRGDVVAFCNPAAGRLSIHRVRARRLGGYVVGGDNNLESDGVIPAGNILGLVTGLERNRRRVRFGMGPERFCIAWLGNHAPLQFLVMQVNEIIQHLRRRQLT